MSSRAGISRCALLGLFQRKEEPAPTPPTVSEPSPGGGFSLEAFYASRAQSGEVTGTSIPVFSLREGLSVPQGAPVAAKTVRIRPQLCLAWQGSFCSTCSERCPVEGAIAVELGRPRVVDERCNGCGLCVQVCPAPINPFEFLSPRPRGSAS